MSSVAWWWLAGAYLSSLFVGARTPLPHVSAPAGLTVSARSCAPCHAEIVRQWRTSRHASSWTNAVFAASFAREPMRWCVHCHAPLVEQAEALRGIRTAGPSADGDSIVDEGVSCAACHVRDGAVLGARPPTAAALVAHPVRVAPLGEAAFCGGCHQFNFPRASSPLRYTDEPMQDTLAEWRASDGKATCQQCHMPGGIHRFAGAHDRALLERTLSASVRIVDGRARVTVRARGAGHRVPTGDPFRRLRVDLCSEGSEGSDGSGGSDCREPFARPIFARTFRRSGDSWTLARDSTLPAVASGESARTVEVALPRGVRAVRWRLVYAFAASSSEADLQGDDRELELARGVAR